MKEALARVNINWPVTPSVKWLADLIGMDRRVDPLLAYLKDTKVGRKEGAAEGDKDMGRRTR